MRNTYTLFKSKDNRDTFLIVFLYCVWTKFFNYAGITTIYYGTVMSLALFACTLTLLPQIFKRQNDPISKSTQRLCLWFFFSIFWCFLYSSQGFYDSLRIYFAPNAGVFPIILFFLFKKESLSLHSIIKSIVIITIIYSLCYVLGLSTIPDPIFGASAVDLSENYESTLENRGVIRLYMQGADFIVLSIMIVITYFEHNKKYYLLLIPLFVMLILRGTRTPFFITTLLCAAYLLFKIKHKIISVVLIVVLAILVPTAQNAVIESRSDNPIVKYIQLTNDQLDKSNADDDIRVEMSEYMFTKFNEGKVLPILFGNGMPHGSGQYSRKLTRLQEQNSYYVVDVGFTDIFIYFGIVGLVLYLLLLIAIIKIRVPHNCFFAKLYMIYLYLILPTNCALIYLSAVMVAMSLYVLYLGKAKPSLTRKNE